MTSDEIETIIIETLVGLQAGSGGTRREITAATTPLVELEFFDSLLGIETTLSLEERLGCVCDASTVFKNKETDRALTIAQIASWLAKTEKTVA